MPSIRKTLPLVVAGVGLSIAIHQAVVVRAPVPEARQSPTRSEGNPESDRLWQRRPGVPRFAALEPASAAAPVGGRRPRFTTTLADGREVSIATRSATVAMAHAAELAPPEQRRRNLLDWHAREWLIQKAAARQIGLSDGDLRALEDVLAETQRRRLAVTSRPPPVVDNGVTVPGRSHDGDQLTLIDADASRAARKILGPDRFVELRLAERNLLQDRYEAEHASR
jgi:hypothetical protein